MDLERGVGVGITKRPSQQCTGGEETTAAAHRAAAADDGDDETPCPWIAGKKKKNKITFLAICLIASPILILLLNRRGSPLPPISGWASPTTAHTSQDVLMGGLLVPGFDERKCISRYNSASYRKNTERSPCPHLINRLRAQEALQRRCGPGTEAYRRAADRLMISRRNGTDDNDDSDCKYLVLVPYRGLGNRMLAMASAFLYAILTGRALLVDKGESSLADLFCEPFPETTWLLPPDFPIRNLEALTGEVPESYRKLVQSDRPDTSVSDFPYVFVDLDHACTYHDKLFYCDDDRHFLHRAPWLLMRTDGYFAPALFLNPAYQDELDRLFPRKDSVFYLLAHYLLHPTNKVWGFITRFYDSYLKDSDERLGIQVRVFDGDTPFKHILDQITACTSQEHLLPEVLPQEPPPSFPSPVAAAAGKRSKAVLMTGLNSWYYENIRSKYWQSATASGEVVSVHQPSHEEHQVSGNTTHDMKALAEMYLLSMADAVVASGWSTFGYVGHGLGGLTPWVMFKPENMTAPDPPCRRAASMEPCLHGPPFYDCRAKRGADTGKLVPHVRHCEDMSWGLKLVHPDPEG
uniref:Fucosyltransferase n=1 Tax=Leersia perrieri TaxID=77586 RepID=A0A0D9WN71_9ORYZ